MRSRKLFPFYALKPFCRFSKFAQGLLCISYCLLEQPIRIIIT
ncbi:hypothetical protein HMPREF1404_00584 [Helicobacter pylori GAM210Bi]|nr:hypothetical protein HMPREF1404_00584 [Helicobacter pylori GAM210Bi]